MLSSDHIYYNVLFKNNSDEMQDAYFTETRSNPILSRPNEYHMSIIRFSIPTFGVPLFVWPLNPDRTPNNTYYYFFFKYKNFQYISYVNFKSWVGSNDLPSVFCVQNFLDMCNEALFIGHDYMVTNVPGYPGTNPPYLMFEPSTQLLSLVADKGYTTILNPGPGEFPIYLDANYQLHTFFESIPHAKILDIASGDSIRFVIENTGDNEIVLKSPINPSNLYASVDGYKMTGEYHVVQNWSSLKSIIITSINLKTKEELIQNQFTINQNSSLQILTDFEPHATSLSEIRAWQNYNANIYRKVDLTSSSEIKNIDIQIYWSDKDNNIYRLKIPPTYYFSIKLLFVKKDLVS
jgi:hypothetical protein